ncbi:MAG: S8 family serine peptidase [Sedimentisphaerales bacterium]
MNRKIAFCLTVTFLLTNLAAAATLHVPADYPTIEAAIAAVSNPLTDTIVVADGNYTPLSSNGFEIAGLPIRLKSENGPQNCIIDCKNIGRAFYFSNGVSSNAFIDGFTIKNGSNYYGGAIECEINCSPTIKNCIIKNNAAVYGGAIDCYYFSSPLIQNCIITNNTADFDGGTIECDSQSSPDVNNCLIAENAAGLDGGAIDCFDTSSPKIRNCTIANNIGDANHGGIYADASSSSTIINSILWNNGDDIYGSAVSSYSCIEDGDTGNHNISFNPLFRPGPRGNYYLSQKAAGQLTDSNCIDIGSTTAVAIFGSANSFTTRTDNVPDSGTVDLGFHYSAAADANCTLTVSVEPNEFGSIAKDPNLALYKRYAEVNLPVTVTDPNYHVGKWIIDSVEVNDANMARVITMDSNHTVIARLSSIIMCELTTLPADSNYGSIDLYNSQRFVQHSSIDVNAYPIPGYVVKKWFKGNTATFNINDPCIAYDPDPLNPNRFSITLDSNTTAAVQFEPNSITHRLTPSVVGGQHGTIDPNKRTFYPEGMIVQLKAAPYSGYRIKTWGGDVSAGDGNSRTVTMDSDKTITVEFEAVPQHQLTVNVTNPALGSVTPGSGLYNEGTIVTLTATPAEGYRVSSWAGDANSKPAWNTNTNTVLMNGNKTVTVTFELDYSRVIHVFGDDANGIQNALNQANNGDTIQIHPGTYVSGPGISVSNKAITIVGDPEHPENVVIDCERESIGITLSATGQQVCTLNGISIINLRTNSIVAPMLPNPLPGTNGNSSFSNLGGAITLIGSHIVKNCIIRNCLLTVSDAYNGIAGHKVWLIADANTPDGGNGGNGGDVGGAGIYIVSGDPNITNVRIENCTVHAGNAGDGAVGFADPTHRWEPGPGHTDPNYFDPGHGGTGGTGGNAFGAGVYARSGSPKFTNVTVSNCVAISGNGGNGGSGPTDGDAGSGNLPGRVLGAGIYCNLNSNPVFVNCTINDCKGYSGIGGNGANGGPTQYRYNRGGYGGLTTDAGANQGDLKLFTTKGGAVFCDSNSTSKFINCTFSDNIVYGSISGIGGYTSTGYQLQPRRNYRLPSFGAGVFCSTASLADFNNCLFFGNRTAYNQDFEDPNYLLLINAQIDIAPTIPYDGEYTGMGGGLCLWYVLYSDIYECNFTQNSAPLGGGIYGEGSDIHITDSNFINNISMGGGGILSLESFLSISNSTISGNIAGTVTGYYPDTSGALFGTGGGVYALDTYADINDTLVTDNFAKITGGGICLDGDNFLNQLQLPRIKNCLITANTAGEEGGGIAAVYFAAPKIINCTIADNIVSNANGNGGGLFASYRAEVIVKDTIFWNNSGNDGSQIALTNGGPFTDMPAKLTITYSDIDLRYISAFDLLQSESSSATTASVLVDSQNIYNQINSTGSAKVIVSLVEPAEAQKIDWSSSASVSELRSQITATQNQVLSTLISSEFTLRNKLTNIAAFSGQINLTGLNKLINNPLVAHIEPVRIVQLALAQGIPLMNAMDTRGTYNGQGLSIAIADTGVDYTHPRLGGGAFPNSKVIGGWDFGDNDSDPMDAEGHGTSCSGIAAGSLGTVGDYIGGVAYNAKIYALKLASSTGGWNIEDDQGLTAWDWCITHKNDDPANPIMVISNSWGYIGEVGGAPHFFSTHQEGDEFSPAYTLSAQRAVDAGITILAASGNEFQTNGMRWPAAMSNVISVGAVYDAAFMSLTCLVQTQPDQVTCYSNTANILDVFAPSENAYTTALGGGYNPYFNGTSAACPYAAGAVAAIQSAAMQLNGSYLTPAQIRTLLKITGKPVTDTKVAITKPRVNVGAAIALLSPSVPIYSEADCTITGLEQDANGIWIISDNHNISQDPNFVLGYYLSSIAALQNFDSPCFDIGSDLAANLGLDTYTTRTDGEYDMGIVDLGYHYFQGLPRYTLTIEADINDANGTIEAPWIPGHTYNVYVGKTISLHAIPDVNVRVAAWILDGQVNETHSRNFNVVMNRSHSVAVRFEPFVYASHNLIVPDEYENIQDAIDAAEDGDTIYIFRKGNGQPYYISSPDGLDLKGKAITIRSENPLDPNVVAATIIDCDFSGRAFIFQNGEDANCVIEGLTIINSLSAGAIAPQPAPYDYGANGSDAAGNGFGGAIFIGKNTSPTIRYCVFSNCQVTGGIGSDGVNGYDLMGQNDQRPRGGNGGNGGNGSGNGYGGAIYCDQDSSPTILNCTINNSTALGGIGGDGGNGGRGTTSKLGGDGGNGGNGSGNGYGGTIYVVKDAKPKIIGCSFVTNSASMGVGGSRGLQGPGQIPTQPPYAQDGYNGQSTGTGYAGVIYYEKGSSVDINNCSFIDNNSIMDGGAVLCEPNCSYISIVKTNMAGNKTFYGGGGAIKFGVNNNIALTDCYFGGNIADTNGGALSIGSLTDSSLCRLDLNNCAFTDNIANGVGGAIAARNIDANFIDCYVNRNTANSGGGLHLISDKSIVKIYGGTIMENKAIGTVAEGGGAYVSNLPIEIINCQITGNTSNYSGAGIMLKGPGTTTSKVHNCLFVQNSAAVKGGAIFVSLNSSPQITSCTFSENKCQSGGVGGAISCAYTSSPTIKDCIFDNTEGTAVFEGSIDSDPVISYCLFNQNDGDFYDYDLNKTYNTGSVSPDVNLAALNAATGGHNVTGDPKFLASDLGGYYLSQTIAGNTFQSPAVNSGSDLAVNVKVLPDDNMADYTTRTDSNNLVSSQGDTGQLDIGFHYIDIEPNKPRQFGLTTTVLGGHGSILPPAGNYYAGTTIKLTVLPVPGWRVNKWTGTDDDGSSNTTNHVVMICNKDVSVSFEQPRNLYVPAEYTSPQDAINHAKDGDKIILAKGTYYERATDYDWGQLVINHKNFTITSTNPDDPCVVAQTALSGNGFWFLNVDSNMILDGITIRDAQWFHGILDCGLPGAHGPTGDGENGLSIIAYTLTLNNASPIIRNCRFVNCSSLASNGCTGTGDYGDGGWAGFAWGGAAFIDSTSNPIFKNCSFIDCFAQGSNGMDGSGRFGHGGNWGDPNFNPNNPDYHTWDFGPYNDPAYYSGYGGAVYCMGGSRPQFEKCLFQGNHSYGGVCGISGSIHDFAYPQVHYAIDTFGGAVYLASGSVATFTSCDFNDNEAHTRGQVGNSDANIPNTATLGNLQAVLYDPVMSYGGAICAEGTAIPIIKDCTFTNNRACAGGGMYWENSIAHISRSNFRNNTSMLGGAVVLADSNSIFFESDFSGNEAVEPIGQGGAIYCVSSAAKFYDCEINGNNASTSGGGVYFAGELEPNMHNCLITNNVAGRDGGGISANWDVQLSLSICTVAHNEATSYGGGLSCAYQANTKIINSIFWSNRVDNDNGGPEISIGSGFDAADKLTAAVTVSYSDIEGGAADVFVDAEHGCILNWDYTNNLAGTTLTNPLFEMGDFGDYYLSQIATGDPLQTTNSKCVDAGFETAIYNDMYRHTTRTDNVLDVADSNVDMGYHYTLTAEILGDFNFDGIVDGNDFILFQQYWMDSDCSFPYFCHGRDLNEDGEVDFEDFALFAANWGQTETTPPKPDPSTWATKPQSAGDTEITMRATTTKDNSGSQVQYKFECVYGSGHNRDWDPCSSYTDTGLSKGAQYGYKVKARDAQHNETGWSVIGYAVAGEDDTPPTPDPMEWATEPFPTSSTSIRMAAKIASDISGVEYYFHCTSLGGHDSNGWQNSTLYNDSGLEPNTAYTYQVKARDKSDSHNETQYSPARTAITLSEGQEPNESNEPNIPVQTDTTPPELNPSTWATVPHAIQGAIPPYYWYHTMTATVATDASPPVEYYFECVTDSHLDSGWITSPTYTSGPFDGPNYNNAYRVRTRDSATPNSNVGNYSQTYHLLDGYQ